MRDLVRGIIILALASVYVCALVAVLHPHVSPAYRAYYIDHVADDYNITVYNTTPEQGMVFSRAGLPPWVRYTHGFSIREDLGRWTDQSLGTTPALVLKQRFDGNLCVDTTIGAVPWLVGDTVTLRMGEREQPLRIQSVKPTEYDVELTNLHRADKIEFILPPKLPVAMGRSPGWNDGRRLGINVASLKLIPGACTASTDSGLK